MRWCAITDIHGQYDALMRLEEFVLRRFPSIRFIYLGDYIDRGPQSKEVLEHIIRQRERGHIVLLGNHELFLTEYLQGEFDEYAYTFGINTIKSLDKNFPIMIDARHTALQRKRITEEYPHLLSFLQSLPFIHEEDDTVFIHGGFNPHLDNFFDSSENDLTCPPYMMPLHAGTHPHRQFVFGHVPVQEYHKLDTSRPYVNKNFTFIDGGAGYGRRLNAYLEDGTYLSTHTNPS